jgi:hypothetical protein
VSAVTYLRNKDTEVEMRHYLTVFTLMALGIVLSACNEGSAVTESDQVANSPAQETAVSSGSETVTQTPTESNTTSGSGQTTVITAPPATTTNTTVKPVTSPSTTTTGGTASNDSTDSANQTPVITGSPALSVDVGESYGFRPNATDGDNDNLTFSINNRPSWAQFNINTGELSGTPAAEDVGDYNNIVISVSDGTKTVSLAAFSIAVNSVGSGPVTGSISLSWIAPRTRTDGSTLNLADIKGYCIYVGTTRDNLEMVVDVNEGDRTSYVLDNLEVGDYYVAVSVYDQQDIMSNYSNVVLKSAVN